jgi:hypothetical protein
MVLAGRPAMAKSKKPYTDREVYDSVVFQGASLVSGPEDTGMLEIATNDRSFGVILNHSNAEFLIGLLQDFIKGRSPHFARDRN